MHSRILSTVFLVLGYAHSGASAADAVFDSNGVKIRYVTAGQGEAVVLIHGWMADATMWGRDRSGNAKLNTTGTEGFHFIALDCRGHGKSDKLYDPDQYGVELAADVVRLLDHLKIAKAHLIGYSSGAFIAGKVAAMHPERVRSVIYAGQAPIIAGQGVKSSSSEVEIFAKAVDDGKGLGAYIRAVMPPGRPTPTAEQADALAKIMFAGKDVKAFAAAGRSFGKLAVTPEQLRACPAPVLFVHGGNESAAVKDQVAMVRKLLGRGDLITIADADHMTTLAKPEFGKAMMEFLRAHSAR